MVLETRILPLNYTDIEEIFMKQQRDLKVNPYSKDEERVAKWLFEKGVGGGDDPIGFLLSSYEYIIVQRNQLRKFGREIDQTDLIV